MELKEFAEQLEERMKKKHRAFSVVYDTVSGITVNDMHRIAVKFEIRYPIAFDARESLNNSLDDTEKVFTDWFEENLKLEELPKTRKINKLNKEDK